MMQDAKDFAQVRGDAAHDSHRFREQEIHS